MNNQRSKDLQQCPHLAYFSLQSSNKRDLMGHRVNDLQHVIFLNFFYKFNYSQPVEADMRAAAAAAALYLVLYILGSCSASGAAVAYFLSL